MSTLSAFFVFSVVCFTVFSVSDGTYITEMDAEKGPCSGMTLPAVKIVPLPETNEVVDFNDGPIWYSPLLSKYEMYQTASLVSGIPVKNLTDDDIKKACIVSKVEGKESEFTLEGFGGKKVIIVTTPGKYGGYYWKVKGEKLNRGEYWITLVGKNFVVGVTCWADGHRSFSSASTDKSFDSETRAVISKHAKALGFNPKYFYDYNYDNCPDERYPKDSLYKLFWNSFP